MTDVNDTAAPTKRIMENRRKRSQRWLAYAAFAYIAIQGMLLTLFLLMSGQREAIAAVFVGMSPLLMATNAMFVSIVLGFMGVSLIEKVKTGD